MFSPFCPLQSSHPTVETRPYGSQLSGTPNFSCNQKETMSQWSSRPCTRNNRLHQPHTLNHQHQLVNTLYLNNNSNRLLLLNMVRRRKQAYAKAWVGLIWRTENSFNHNGTFSFSRCIYCRYSRYCKRLAPTPISVLFVCVTVVLYMCDNSFACLSLTWEL